MNCTVLSAVAALSRFPSSAFRGSALLSVGLPTVLWIGGGVLLFLLLISPIAMGLIASHFVYRGVLVRTSKETWGRHVSEETPEQVEMDRVGVRWMEKYADAKRDVHIVNEGFNLYGEFFDFGSDRAVILVPGRTESLRYSYFFAEPYRKAGWSVLVIDQRAHGLSDGEYNDLGFSEWRDLVAWGKFLTENTPVRKILLHGICIGASCSLFAMTSENCPDFFCGMIADGMYEDFAESLKNHLIERKKPTIVNPFVGLRVRIRQHHSMYYGPKDVIGKYHGPLLMLHSREDIYSRPEQAQKLFDACPSEKKKLVWFPSARHSMIRINHPDEYDAAVTEFIATL